MIIILGRIINALGVVMVMLLMFLNINGIDGGYFYRVILCFYFLMILSTKLFMNIGINQDK